MTAELPHGGPEPGSARQGRRSGRWLLLAVAAVTAVLAAWFGGFVWFIGELPREVAEPERRTDAIVVLTGGPGRVGRGLELLAARRAEKLLVSGVHRGVDVAELLRVSRRAPEELACCVSLGYEAGSTRGNARETADWMRAEGFRSLRLVTAAYHMPRSLLEFRRVMDDVVIVPHPVFPGHVKQDDWWRWPGSAHLLLGEYTKFLLALAASAFLAADTPAGS